jgi:hypothetical protein
VTIDQIQAALTNSQGPVTNRYTIDQGWIGPDGRASTTKFLTPSTPGVFGQAIYIYGKNYFGLDAAINKQIKLTEKLKFDLQAGSANVLNHPEWGIANLNIQSTTFGQTGSPMNGARTMYFRGLLSF